MDRPKNIIKFVANVMLYIVMVDLNHIKVVQVEKNITNKWLAQQLGKDSATVLKWCTNVPQSDLLTLN